MRHFLLSLVLPALLHLIWCESIHAAECQSGTIKVPQLDICATDSCSNNACGKPESWTSCEQNGNLHVCQCASGYRLQNEGLYERCVASGQTEYYPKELYMEQPNFEERDVLRLAISKAPSRVYVQISPYIYLKINRFAKTVGLHRSRKSSAVNLKGDAALRGSLFVIVTNEGDNVHILVHYPLKNGIWAYVELESPIKIFHLDSVKVTAEPLAELEGVKVFLKKKQS